MGFDVAINEAREAYHVRIQNGHERRWNDTTARSCLKSSNAIRKAEVWGDRCPFSMMPTRQVRNGVNMLVQVFDPKTHRLYLPKQFYRKQFSHRRHQSAGARKPTEGSPRSSAKFGSV